MDFNVVLFWILAAVTGGCAIAVVLSQNIVRAAVWLLFTLCGAAGVFFLLGAPFLGATQLLVYVGGTLVLVVFGVMLTAQGPFINMRIGAGEWAISAVVGGFLFTILALTVITIKVPRAEEPAQMTSSVTLGQSLLGLTDATPHAALTGVPATDPLKPSGKADPIPRRRVAYLLPFEIVSVHLLVVLIGAAYLARAKRRKGAAS
jgi:NADH-quinone oxidoreductase subunit J